MKTFTRFLPLVILIFCAKNVFAQDKPICDKSTIERAWQAYNIGNFDFPIERLSACIQEGNFDQEQLVDAYRILTLVHIANESVEDASIAAINLLKINPSFTPSTVDPVEFQKLVTDVKVGIAERYISSVSKTNEDPLEAPAAITVITAEQIQRRGYRSIDELLLDVTGFDLSKGKGVSRANIAQRGYRSNVTDRTLFLVDGVEENDLLSEHAYISTQYSMSNIKRVEIIYGPASTMYGANAFAGVINIITKESGSNLGASQSVGVSAEAGYGTWNTKYFDVTASGRTGSAALSITARVYQSDEMDLSGYEEWDYRLGNRAHYENNMIFSAPLNDNNYIDYTANHPYIDRIETGDSTRTFYPSVAAIDEAMRLDQNAMDTTLQGHPIGFTNHTNNWSVNGKLKIGNFTTGFNIWRREEGSIGWFNDRRAGSRNGSVWIPKFSSAYIKYETYLNRRISVTLFTRYRNHQVDGDTKSVTLSSYDNGALNLASLLDTTASSWRTTYFYTTSKQLRTEARAVYSAKNFTLISGLEYRNSLIQGNYITSSQEFPSETGTPPDVPGGNNFEMNDFGLYAQGTYQFMQNTEVKSVKLVGGLRMDHNVIRKNGGYGTVYNARLALVYKPMPNMVIKALYASAFKDASSWTKYSTTNDRKLPNPGLEPETVDNIEVSFYKKIGNFSFDVVGYRSAYSNVVGSEEVVLTQAQIDRFDIDGTAGETTLQNRAVGSQLIQGIQANVGYQREQLSVYANYTYTNPKNTSPDNDEFEEDAVRIGDIAKHRFNLGANYLWNEWLNFNIRMNAVGSQPSGEGTTVSTNPITEFGNYAIFNASIQYRSQYLEGLVVQLTANNLFDTEYFHPGVRTAAGNTYTPRFPQERRNFMLRIMYQL